MLIFETLRKKGGIFIKKINIFLMIIASIFIAKNLVINVKAENASFYEAEYIDNIYMNKYDYSNNYIYYQKARFFRKQNTNEFAYCLEPFRYFNETSDYYSTINPRNLSNSQIDRIAKIAHFGYGYDNHTDPKWYAITQLMIWKEANPTNSDFYFTDSLNGRRIEPFNNEINEINNLINEYSILPSFSDKNYTIVEGENLVLEDTNNVLSKYKTDNITINNNKIELSNLKEGNYIYNLSKEENKYNKPYIFYQSNTSQNLIQTGDISSINTKFQVKVIKTSINLVKLDKDTHTYLPQGNAYLDGAIYTLYDENNNEVANLEIIDNKASINNISFGKYYLKETKSGIGYLLDTNVYEINISEDNPNIDLTLENKVIDKKIMIEKKYGNESILKSEKDISFEIYNSNNILIKTITTNSLGIAEVILPYGEYKLIQINSTEGYKKVDPITIKVDDTLDESILLKDLKIPVPDTHVDNKLLILIIKYFLVLW